MWVFLITLKSSIKSSHPECLMRTALPLLLECKLTWWTTERIPVRLGCGDHRGKRYWVTIVTVLSAALTNIHLLIHTHIIIITASSQEFQKSCWGLWTFIGHKIGEDFFFFKKPSFDPRFLSTCCPIFLLFLTTKLLNLPVVIVLTLHLFSSHMLLTSLQSDFHTHHCAEATFIKVIYELCLLNPMFLSQQHLAGLTTPCSWLLCYPISWFSLFVTCHSCPVSPAILLLLTSERLQYPRVLPWSLPLLTYRFFLDAFINLRPLILSLCQQFLNLLLQFQSFSWTSELYIQLDIFT